MPSPKKRKIRKAVGNIHPGGVLSDAQKTDTFVEVLLSENGHNYASANALYANGETVALRTEDSNDGLLTAGEQDAATAQPAQLNVVFGATGPNANGLISLTGSAGDAVAFKFRDGANDAEKAGSDADPVLVKGNGADEAAHATNFMTVLATAMSGTIKAFGAATAGSTHTVTLTQNVEGAAGNTPVFTNALTDVTLSHTSFVGGANAIKEITGGIKHYWFDTTNSAASIALAAAAGTAITASSGIIYDPSGPKSKYISGCETVSSGSAKFVVIKPEAWDANDQIAIEIVGDTNSGTGDDLATADKISLLKITESAGASAAINAIGDYDLSGTETGAAFTNVTGTIDHNTTLTYETAAAGGFVIKWERDATGLAEADINKGWYIRWNTTAI